MKNILLGTAFSALAIPAMAGNLEAVYNEPVIQAPAQVYVAQGYDWTGGYVGVQLGYGELNASGAATADGSGVIGGVHAGYDYDFGSFVLGAGIDYNVADLDINVPNTSLDSLTRVKVRAGFESGAALFYGTAGGAYAEAEVGGTNFSDSGYFVGVGMDYMVTDKVSVGGEILYHEFDNFDNTGVDIDATTFQAKVSYRF